MGNKAIVNQTEEYRKLRSRIDVEIKRLEELHGSDITCHPGCATCCINLTVFPVEFFTILEDLKKTDLKREDFIFDDSTACGFLHEELCRIYPFRPIICRTHGLPILFLDESQEIPAWKVSFCELNFPNKTGIEFSVDTLLDIEQINAELNSINASFIASLTGDVYSANERIPLKKLYEAIIDAGEPRYSR
jgi:uncharacterized protein